MIFLKISKFCEHCAQVIFPKIFIKICYLFYACIFLLISTASMGQALNDRNSKIDGNSVEVSQILILHNYTDDPSPIVPVQTYTPIRLTARLLEIAEGSAPEINELEHEFGFEAELFKEHKYKNEYSRLYRGKAPSPPFLHDEYNIFIYDFGKTISIHWILRSNDYMNYKNQPREFCISVKSMEAYFSRNWVRADLPVHLTASEIRYYKSSIYEGSYVTIGIVNKNISGCIRSFSVTFAS